MKKTLYAFGIIVVAAGVWFALPSQCRIDGFPRAESDRVCEFLTAQDKTDDRKVAVFDIDGTLFGQVPYYLADEALFMDAKKKEYNKRSCFEGYPCVFNAEAGGKDCPVYCEDNDPYMVHIIDSMIAAEDRSGHEYVQLRIKYLAGNTIEQIEEIGDIAFREKYRNKSYAPMKSLVAQLQKHGFEVWGLTASPAYLYRGFIAREFRIPKDRILGTTGVMKDGVMTDEILLPIAHGHGKAEIIKTVIGAAPRIVGGNSDGDYEMLMEATGLRIIVNPGDKFQNRFEGDDKAITVMIPDEDNGADFLGRQYGIKENIKRM